MARFIALGLALAFALGAYAQDSEEEEEGETEIEIGVPPKEEDEERPSGGERTPAERKGGGEFTNGGFTIRLPEEWIAQPRDASERVFAFDLDLPGTRAPAVLQVVRFDRMGDPRTAPYYYRENAMKTFNGKRAERRARPLPMLIVHFEQRGQPQVAALAFRSIRGNCFHVAFECPEDAWTAQEKVFLAMVKDIESDLPRWPAIPEGYRTKRKGAFLWALHPSVKGSLSSMHKLAAWTEKRFRKTHGKLPKPEPGTEPVIYVLTDRMQASALHEKAAERDFSTDLIGRRAFAVRVHEGSDINARGSFVWNLHYLLFYLRYGDVKPDWIAQGESQAAFAECVTQKPLPFVHASLVTAAAGLGFVTVPELEAVRERDSEGWRRQAFYSVAVLRAGPSRYRAAYKRFLKEYAATSDWESALRNHLEPLDWEALRDAARRYLERTVKPYEPKH